jgi:hypothetical protein
MPPPSPITTRPLGELVAEAKAGEALADEILAELAAAGYHASLDGWELVIMGELGRPGPALRARIREHHHILAWWLLQRATGVCYVCGGATMATYDGHAFCESDLPITDQARARYAAAQERHTRDERVRPLWAAWDRARADGDRAEVDRIRASIEDICSQGLPLGPVPC